LCLSHELRDQIYAYALNEPEGTFCYREEYQPRSTTSERDKDGINQLKHSCQQLLAGTTGLDIEINSLISSKIGSEVEGFDEPVGFLRRIPAISRRKRRPCDTLNSPVSILQIATAKCKKLNGTINMVGSN